MNEPLIENGFAKVGGGTWLVGANQPAAALGTFTPKNFRGWLVPDRSRVHLVENSGTLWCAEKERPFLTHIACAAPISVVSDRLLLAPAAARSASTLVRVIPFSVRNAICVTECTKEWIVLATRSRLVRIVLEEGELLTTRLECAVAWSTPKPTGFCPKLKLTDILLPKKRNNNLMLHFYGPGIVWLEGANAS